MFPLVLNVTIVVSILATAVLMRVLLRWDGLDDGDEGPPVAP